MSVLFDSITYLPSEHHYLQALYESLKYEEREMEKGVDSGLY